MPREIGIDELRNFLDQTVEITNRPECEEVMKNVLELTKEQLYLGFQAESSPDGKRWPALKNPRRPPRNQNNKPLLDTYKLQKSVTEDAEDHVEGVSNQGLTLGTYVEYAGVHQDGSTKKNIPQRKFLGFSEIVQELATDDVASSVIKQIDNL
ncbi:phage virion morphogenesis protein [Gimesia sp.]|uniref:phage virion morphogenesis protein n=1 Tax=Gimesia sp. TaxID=2024833 RepID=UPI003A8D14AC